MATTYPGFQSYVSSAPSPTSPYGQFVAGNATDDGDLDDAAHLMALAMANTDSLQWCGWRINYLNPVEGSAGNSALTAAIVNYNNWDFKGPIIFEGVTTQFSAGVVLFQTAAKIVQGKTLNVGDSTLGVGHVIADGTGSGAGSSIVARNGASMSATGSGSVLSVGNSAQFTIDGTASAAIAGPTTYSGSVGYVGRRDELSAPAVTQTIDCKQGDTFAIPSGISADVVCTLTTPSANIDVTFYTMGGNSYNFYIMLPGAVTAVAKFLLLNAHASVTLRYTGTRWILLASFNEGGNVVTTVSSNAIP